MSTARNDSYAEPEATICTEFRVRSQELPNEILFMVMNHAIDPFSLRIANTTILRRVRSSVSQPMIFSGVPETAKPLRAVNQAFKDGISEAVMQRFNGQLTVPESAMLDEIFPRAEKSNPSVIVPLLHRLTHVTLTGTGVDNCDSQWKVRMLMRDFANLKSITFRLSIKTSYLLSDTDPRARVQNHIRLIESGSSVSVDQYAVAWKREMHGLIDHDLSINMIFEYILKDSSVLYEYDLAKEDMFAARKHEIRYKWRSPSESPGHSPTDV